MKQTTLNSFLIAMKTGKIKERLCFNGTMDEYMELMNP